MDDQAGHGAAGGRHAVVVSVCMQAMPRPAPQCAASPGRRAAPGRPACPPQIAMLQATLAKKKKRRGPGKMFKKVGRAHWGRSMGTRVAAVCCPVRGMLPCAATWADQDVLVLLGDQSRIVLNPCNLPPLVAVPCRPCHPCSAPPVQAAEAIRQGLSPDRELAAPMPPQQQAGTPSSGAGKAWGSLKSKFGSLGRTGSSREDEAAPGMSPRR